MRCCRRLRAACEAAGDPCRCESLVRYAALHSMAGCSARRRTRLQPHVGDVSIALAAAGTVLMIDRLFSLALSTFGLAFPFVVMLQGCQTLPRRDAVPLPFTEQAVVVEAPAARYWPEQDIDPMLKDA